MNKIKEMFNNHKKKIITIGAVVVTTLLAVVLSNQYSEAKKHEVEGRKILQVLEDAESKDDKIFRKLEEIIDIAEE